MSFNPLFWRKLNREEECELLTARQDQERLRQYDELVKKLKKFDWFEFNSGGGIVAHEKNEPIEEGMSYGTGFVVPEEYIRIRYS